MPSGLHCTYSAWNNQNLCPKSHVFFSEEHRYWYWLYNYLRVQYCMYVNGDSKGFLVSEYRNGITQFCLPQENEGNGFQKIKSCLLPREFRNKSSWKVEEDVVVSRRVRNKIFVFVVSRYLWYRCLFWLFSVTNVLPREFINTFKQR